MIFYSQFSVKYKSFSAVAAILAACFAFSACHRVSEEPLETDFYTANNTVITEETTQTAGLTSEQQTEEITTQNEVESEIALQTEITSAVTDVSEKTSQEEKTELSTTETTKKTLKNQEKITSKEVTETETETTASTDDFEVTTTKTQPTVTELTIQSESPMETAANSYNTSGYSALNYREQKGIWISYLEYSSAMQNKSASAFRDTVGKYFDNVKALSFNTVYVQVRAFGDAY